MMVYFLESYTNKDNTYPKSIDDMMDVMRQQPGKRKKTKPLKYKDKDKDKSKKTEDEAVASYTHSKNPGDYSKKEHNCYCLGKPKCVPSIFPDNSKPKSEWANPDFCKYFSRILKEEYR